MLYIAEGALGLPVFAGMKGGLAVLAGPTAGYIFGFALAAAAVGWLAERGWDRTILATIVAMAIGIAFMAITMFFQIWGMIQKLRGRSVFEEAGDAGATGH